MLKQIISDFCIQKEFKVFQFFILHWNLKPKKLFCQIGLVRHLAIVTLGLAVKQLVLTEPKYKSCRITYCHPNYNYKKKGITYLSIGIGRHQETPTNILTRERTGPIFYMTPSAENQATWFDSVLIELLLLPPLTKKSVAQQSTQSPQPWGSLCVCMKQSPSLLNSILKPVS